MNENTEFKPYIPAEKVTPELTVTSVIMGCILAVIFGAANAYLGLRVGMTVSASNSGGSYLHGCYPRNSSQKLHSGEQYGPDYRFSR